MKLQKVELEVELSGIEAEGKFKMKATAKAFDILSSALYSDKILAVVRELSCNAHDSHVAAGKRDVPIEIHLPTIYEPTFYVKDFGTGMSHLQLMEMYTTYFDSTKTDSDDYIGQLGLGSKSPFSYSTTFLVESRYEGVVRHYSCFKDEDNMPSIAMLGEEPTDECNGLKVTMAIKTADCDKFYNAARKALMYFNPQPTVIGRDYFKPYAVTHTVEGDGWKIRDAEYYSGMTGAHVVQGFVTYPVDAEQLAAVGLTSTAKTLTQTDIDMYVPIGKVETAASREALSYDKWTVTNLIAFFEKAAAEMRKSFQDEFDACKTQMEVAMTLDRFQNSGGERFKNLFAKMHAETPFDWNGVTVSNFVSFELPTTKDTSITYISTKKRKYAVGINPHSGWHPTAACRDVSLAIRANTFVVIDDQVKYPMEVIRNWLHAKPSFGGRTAHGLILRPITKTQYNQAEMDEIITLLGNPTVVKTSEMPPVIKPPRAKTSTSSGRTATKRGKDDRPVWRGFTFVRGRQSRKFSYLTWENKPVDLAAGGLYVEVDRYTVYPHEGIDGTYIGDLKSYAEQLGLIGKEVPVVGLSRKDIEQVEKDSPGAWSHLYTHVKAEFVKANIGNALYRPRAASTLTNHLGWGITKQFVDEWEEVEPKLHIGPFKSALAPIAAIKANAGKHSMSVVDNLSSVLGFTYIAEDDADAEVNKLIENWTAAYAKYEMFQLIPRGNMAENVRDLMIRYIALIDRDVVAEPETVDAVEQLEQEESV